MASALVWMLLTLIPVFSVQSRDCIQGQKKRCDLTGARDFPREESAAAATPIGKRVSAQPHFRHALLRVKHPGHKPPLLKIGTAAAQPREFVERTTDATTNGLDPSVKPGDDFFSYANGAWLNTTEMPPGKGRLTTAVEISERTKKQVSKLLEDTQSSAVGTTARKVADFRSAYLAESHIEAKGISPIKPMLDRIDRLRDKAALTRFLGSTIKADVDPMNAGIFNSSHVLGIAVQASIHGEKTYSAFLVQGGLSLPGRESYLSAEPVMQSRRNRYLEAISSVLTTTGLDPDGTARRRAESVLALETAIAETHASEEASGNERNADHIWTRADFVRKAPGMDWTSFLAAAGIAKQSALVAWQPSAVKGLAALVGSQPLSVWKDYLRVRTIAEAADVLPRAIADQAPALRGEEIATLSQMTRAQRATEITQSTMREAIGQLYVEKHFPAAHKARVKTIVANVTNAFIKRVEAVTWMSPSSKTVAISKLKAMYFGVGYPEKWHSLSDLRIDPTDPVGNLRRVAERNYRLALAKLGKPVDNTEWSLSPQSVGGVLLFQQNAYNFTAALLQSPKFDASASDAMNYGAIGAIAGHEISHFVDSLGADYEANGRATRWWTKEDVARYEKAYTPLVNQFSSYQPFPDAAVDGKLTLTENIADLGGLVAAFDAYRATLGKKIADKEYVRQQDQQFFTGYARSWRTKYREDALRKQLTTDHAPENYRIATVRNLDAWYDAFDVKPGQRLYLAPGERVRIW